MSRTAKEILKEIDMKAAFFVDSLKIPVKPEDITIFINEAEYEIVADYATMYLLANYSDFTSAKFDSYKGMKFTLAQYIKDIQIGLKLRLPEAELPDNTKRLQQEEK